MSQPLRILHLEDDPADAALIARRLETAGFSPVTDRVESEVQFLAGLDRQPDIILSDFTMPEFCGLRALELLNERGLEIPFMLVSGTIGEETAVEAMKNGATDYLLKDRLSRLGHAVKQALAQHRLRRERSRALESLRESEERFRQLAENIREVFYIADPRSGELIYVSPAYETVWGRPLAALQHAPTDWLEAVHPEDRTRIEYALSHKRVRGTFDEEYRIRRPEGTLRWIHDRAFPVRQEGGEVQRIVGVASDITDRKRAEDSIRASERRFVSFMDNLPGFAWIKDAEGHYAYANKAVRDLLFGDREWMGREDRDIWPGLAPEYCANDRAVLHTKEPRQFTETAVVEGERRILLNSKFPILNDERVVEFICGVGVDITERQRAEEQLLEQAELLNRAQDAIIVRDLDGRIQFWNRGAEVVYAWKAEEAIGQLAGDLLNTDLERYEMARRIVLEKGEWTGELRHIRKGGALVTVDSRWTLLRHADGRPKSILVINSDVTEHRKLESQFLRAQRLESIGTLASGVAHDLNNILAPILMAAPVLRNDLSPEVRDKILETIELSAQRGADIVRQVLTFARGVEGDKLLVEPTHLVREMAKIVKETFPKSIEIVAKYESHIWPVEGDPTQLHQVLLNLCVNARDAMPNGGELAMSVENLNVDEHYAAMMPGARPGPHVIIQVSDTGTGIPRGILDQIFDPFFTTKEQGQGTGLGLSTVVGIVKSHDGFLNVYSEVGRGTTFKVFLPAAADGYASAPAPEAEPPRGNGELLLLVDDERSIREIAQTILQSHGYEVLVAADGPEALAVFAMRMAEIKAVLTDVMMPLLDGLTLIRTLRKMRPDIRLIASTGRSDDKRVAELNALNVPICLSKPYNKLKLLNAVRDTLAGMSPC